MHGRRRRPRAAVWLTGASAVLVIGGAAVTTGLVRLHRDRPAAPAAAAGADAAPPRGPDRITLDLDPTSGYVAVVRGTDAGRQFVTAGDYTFEAAGAEQGRYAGEVTAFDPGAFDGAALRGGERFPLAGHDAWFVAAHRFGDGGRPGPAIGWADGSGVWIVVHARPGARVGRENLEKLAASVTLAPPRELRTPFRLGALPDGLAATYVRSVEGAADGRGGTVGLSPPGRPASGAAVYDAAPPGVTVTVSATAPDRTWAAEKRGLTGRVTVAGHTGWYATGDNPISPDGAGSALVVETGACVLRLHTADRAVTGPADLERLVADMTVGDCADPDTWIAPLS